MHVLVVFGNQWRRIVVYVLLHDYVNVRECNLQNPHHIISNYDHTGHIENHKQHTADLQLVALFPSRSRWSVARAFTAAKLLNSIFGSQRRTLYFK